MLKGLCIKNEKPEECWILEEDCYTSSVSVLGYPYF